VYLIILDTMSFVLRKAIQFLAAFDEG
jgi:hypothetical protein